MPQKIIIDTDPGIDDTMAIFFALRCPELEVIGLTTIFGNVFTPQATHNALRLLEIAGRPDIPVAHGAEKPLVADFPQPSSRVHGEYGQGALQLEAPTTQPHPLNAAQFIIQEVMRQPGDITLVAVGPLTNLALAVRLEPRIAQQVREVVVMGGNPLEPGNITPTAEANFYHDPEAADMVLGAGWPLTLVSLDVTHRAIMTPEQLDLFAQAKNPLAQHIGRILPHYRGFFREARGRDSIFVHDSTAIAYLLHPGWFQTQRGVVRVETQGMSRGKSWMNYHPVILSQERFAPWLNRPEINVCTGIDGAASIAFELERVLAD